MSPIPKEPKAKNSIAEALLRDMQGATTKKLALFEKLEGAIDLTARIAPSFSGPSG